MPLFSRTCCSSSNAIKLALRAALGAQRKRLLRAHATPLAHVTKKPLVCTRIPPRTVCIAVLANSRRDACAPRRFVWLMLFSLWLGVFVATQAQSINSYSQKSRTFHTAEEFAQITKGK